MTPASPHSTAREDGSCDDCGSFHGIVGRLPWQSIDSAPRDGTEILCFCPDIGMRVLHWEDGAWWLTGCTCDDYEPTHWLIIEPPSARA